MASAPDCEACATMATMIREGRSAPPSLILHTGMGLGAMPGRIADYRRNQSRCQPCRALLSEFTTQCAFYNQEPPEDHDQVEMVYLQWLGTWRIQLVPPEPTGFYVPRAKSHLSFARCVDPRRPDTPPPSLEDEVTAITIDASRIDFDRVMRWKARCDANHEGTCFAIRDPWMAMERFDKLSLIDVADQCISQQPGSGAYLALSYVWGVGDSPLTASTANIDALCRPGSLDPDSPLGRRLPRSIRDAMTVTSRLGYRYLWVDRLCIIQDDDAHRRLHLASMAAIYANASITIIASHGDDSHGLPGVEPDRSPLRRPFSTLSLPGSVNILYDDSKGLEETYELPSDRDYRRRGWTLQEETLSNRSLNFGHREVGWKCRKMRCREIYDDQTQLKDNRKSSLEVQLYKPYADIGTYSHLAMNYTGRLLTYDTDAVHAFTAIIAAFSRSMKGGMLYGLPELFFEGMMLWQPREPLLRRRQRNHESPSWSFLGWSGRGLDLGTWSELYNSWGRSSDGQHFRSASRLISCIQYFKVDSQTGARSLIQSSYYNDATRRLLSRGAGGQRTSPDPSDPSMDDASDYTLFVRFPSEPLTTANGSWLPTLEFRTQRCYIPVGDVIPRADGDEGKGCLDVCLEDQNGGVIGAIRLNATHRDEVCPGTRLGLVVISRCIASQPRVTRTIPELRVFHAKCFQLCFDPKRCQAEGRFVPYDFYNVMWIGWNGNVAYRKAVGRVLVSYWDEQEPEDVEITLG